MVESLTQSTSMERLGWVLVHSLWQFVLVALAAIILQWVLKRRSAATRYGTLLAAMLMMVVAPVATWFSPWSVDTSPPAAKLVPVATPEAVALLEEVPRSQPEGDMPPMAAAGLPAAEHAAANPPAAAQGVEPAARGPVACWSRTKSRVQPWLPEIVLAWLAGVLLAAFRPLWSWHTVRRLRRVGVSPVGEAVHGVLDHTARRLGLIRAVEVLQSTLVKTPVVLGYFRPLVLLPLCVVTGLPEAQLELVLAHELAHIRRHDYLVNLFQTLVETLFFYHPAVWWLSRQVRNERENCCDDVAIVLSDSRADYGRALLAIEKLRAAAPSLSLAASGGSLLARIRRIAGHEPAPRFVGGGSILGVILVSMALFAAVTWGAAKTAEKPTGNDPAEKTSERRAHERGKAR